MSHIRRRAIFFAVLTMMLPRIAQAAPTLACNRALLETLAEVRDNPKALRYGMLTLNASNTKFPQTSGYGYVGYSDAMLVVNDEQHLTARFLTSMSHAELGFQKSAVQQIELDFTDGLLTLKLNPLAEPTKVKLLRCFRLSQGDLISGFVMAEDRPIVMNLMIRNNPT